MLPRIVGRTSPELATRPETRPFLCLGAALFALIWPAPAVQAQTLAPEKSIARLYLHGPVFVNGIDGRAPKRSEMPFIALKPGRRAIDACLWVRWTGNRKPRYTALCRQTTERGRAGERVVQEGGPFPDGRREFLGGRRVMPRRIVFDAVSGRTYRLAAQRYAAAISPHNDVWRVWVERRTAGPAGTVRWEKIMATVRIPAPGEAYPPFARRTFPRAGRP